MDESSDSFDDFVADSQEDEIDSQNNKEIEEKPEVKNEETMIEMNDQAKVEEAGENENIMRILVATDIHCGYGENKPVIHDDSINTFEEVLQIATEQKVDFVLLGGDLFHENRPSREVLNKVTRLLRKYCLNDNPIAIEFLSDPSINFSQSLFPNVNFYDENINIGLPIFTIHGNHDDLSGKNLTALDNLHEAGLINLFGKHEQIRHFEISPILLRKGETRLALFGIGSQRDDRLARAFQEDSVTFYRPKAGAEDWFNLFVLHQNRPRRSMIRSTGSYLPESMIPNFFDLLIWGHEHESKPQPQYVASSEAVGDGFYILQPGSTVATSLTEDEALPKNAFLLKIKGRKFSSKPIPLQTTRVIVVDELTLDTIPHNMKIVDKSGRPKNQKGQYCDELAIYAKLDEMIEKAKSIKGPRQQWPPLIRLKVTYEKDWENIQPLHGKRYGYKYDGLVANPSEMVVITKKKTVVKKAGKSENSKDSLHDRLGNVSATNLQYIVNKNYFLNLIKIFLFSINDYFSNLPLAEKMTILKPEDIGKALEKYSDEGEKISSANAQFVESLKNQMEVVRKTLNMMPLPEMTNENEMGTFREMIEADVLNMKKSYYEKKGEIKEKRDEDILMMEASDNDSDHSLEEFCQTIPQMSHERMNFNNKDDDDSMPSSDESEKEIQILTAPKRGRGRGRGTTTTNSRARKNAL